MGILCLTLSILCFGGCKLHFLSITIIQRVVYLVNLWTKSSPALSERVLHRIGTSNPPRRGAVVDFHFRPGCTNVSRLLRKKFWKSARRLRYREERNGLGSLWLACYMAAHRCSAREAGSANLHIPCERVRHGDGQLRMRMWWTHRQQMRACHHQERWVIDEEDLLPFLFAGMKLRHGC